jgi:hypothetical protein
MGRRDLAIIAAGLLAFSATGCTSQKAGSAGQPADGAKIKLGLVTKTDNSPKSHTMNEVVGLFTGALRMGENGAVEAAGHAVMTGLGR